MTFKIFRNRKPKIEKITLGIINIFDFQKNQKSEIEIKNVNNSKCKFFDFRFSIFKIFESHDKIFETLQKFFEVEFFDSVKK